MAADVPQPGRHIVSTRELLTDDTRGTVVAHNGPCRSSPLFVVKRVFPGGDFAPTGNAVRYYFDQDNVAFVSAAEAGFKEVNQRHPHLAQMNAFDLQASFPKA